MRGYARNLQTLLYGPSREKSHSKKQNEREKAKSFAVFFLQYVNIFKTLMSQTSSNRAEFLVSSRAASAWGIVISPTDSLYYPHSFVAVVGVAAMSRPPRTLPEFSFDDIIHKSAVMTWQLEKDVPLPPKVEALVEKFEKSAADPSSPPREIPAETLFTRVNLAVRCFHTHIRSYSASQNLPTPVDVAPTVEMLAVFPSGSPSSSPRSQSPRGSRLASTSASSHEVPRQRARPMPSFRMRRMSSRSLSPPRQAQVLGTSFCCCNAAMVASDVCVFPCSHTHCLRVLLPRGGLQPNSEGIQLPPGFSRAPPGATSVSPLPPTGRYAAPRASAFLPPCPCTSPSSLRTWCSRASTAPLPSSLSRSRSLFVGEPTRLRRLQLQPPHHPLLRRYC